jgi:hypothetical protein
MLTKASEAGHIAGVAPHLIPGGISHLQYADDTLILVQYNEQHISNLKFLLMCFEEMSGLKINYHKSEVMVMGQSPDIMQRVADMLNCKLGEFPFVFWVCLSPTVSSPWISGCSLFRSWVSELNRG